MAKYAYRTVDLQSNAVLEDIDLQDVEFNIRLSNAGDLSGKLFVPESKRGLLLDDATVPGRTGLYVLRNGTPVWGGIIWQREWDEATSTFSLSCGSWESYAYHLLQLNNMKFTNTDQFTIARQLLANNGLDVESGIGWPTIALSGVTRQRDLYAYEYKTVGLELEQLAGLENGFDYTVESYIKTDGSFGRRYQFGYPRLGRAASLNPSSNSLTFDYPGNLAPFKLAESAENGATSLFAIGSGEGEAMLVAHAGDGSLGLGPLPGATQAAMAIRDRIGATGSINPTNILNWTWPGAPAVVFQYGAYLGDLCYRDDVGPFQTSVTTNGELPDGTKAAQDIYDRMNSGGAIRENDWGWTGAPRYVTNWGGALLYIYLTENKGDVQDIAASKAFLQRWVKEHPALQTVTVTGIDWDPVVDWLQEYIDTHPRAYRFNPTPDTAYGPWPRLDATASYKSVVYMSTLQSHANEDIKQLLPPIDSWTFQLAPDSDVQLPDINIGDSAVFRLTSRRWREPKIIIRRITEIRVRPGTPETLEVIELGLSEERT